MGAPGAPDGGPGTTLSYAGLFAAADRAAASLRARGVGPGDRVAFFLGNRPEFAVAYLAVLRLGAVMVPMNLAYRRREIAHILADAEPVLLLTEAARLPVLDELEPEERRSLCAVVLAEELADWKRCRHLLSAGRPGRPGADPLHLRHHGPQQGGDDHATATSSRRSPACSPPGPGSPRTRSSSPCRSSTPTAWWWASTAPWRPARPSSCASASTPPRRRAELLGGEPTLFFGVPTMYVRLVETLTGRGESWSCPACASSAPAARRSPPKPSPPSAS